MRNIPKIAHITQYGTGEPLLESHIPPLNIKQIPKDLTNSIEMLKHTAAHHQLLSLSANQILLNHRMFAILKQPFIQPAKWNNYQVSPADYQIIINPKLDEQSDLRLKDFQQCPSFPGIRFHIWNPVAQSYKYYSPIIASKEVKLQQKGRQLFGFSARVWDHEVRHLDGILALDPRVSHLQFSVAENYRDNPAMFQIVQLFKQQMHFVDEKNLKKFLVTQKKNSSGKFKKDGQSLQEIPQKITKQMKGRMNKQMLRIKQLMARQNNIKNPQNQQNF